MNWFVACVCGGIMVLVSPPRATSEAGGQRLIGVVTEAEGAGKVQGKGVAIFDIDGDGDLDVFVTGRAQGQVGKGVVVADLDNDGWPDVYVSQSIRIARLYHNNGNGTFTDITPQVRTRDPVIETIRIEGGKVEISGQSIKVEGGKVEIIRRKP